MGSRGDISPLLAIARVLAERGDDVSIGCTEESLELVRSHGFEPRVLTSLNLKDYLQSDAGQEKFFGASTTTQLRALGELADAHADEFDANLIELCRDVECVIGTRIIEEQIALVTHRTGVPLVMVEFFPGNARIPVPNPLLEPRLQDVIARIPMLRPLTYWLFDLGWAISVRKKTVDLARRVDYPERIVNPRSVLDHRDILRVEAFGAGLVPEAVRGPASPRIGFIRIADRPSDRAELDARVAAWLDHDDRPVVYLGFGSMPVRDFDGLVADLSADLATSGVRLLAVPGWSARTGNDTVESDDLLIVGEVDHDVVLSRCAALVHHGGAGTTAVAAASGTPSLVCSQAFDQHFWGRRIEACGAGLVLGRGTMTAASIATSVRRLLGDPAIIERARQLGVAGRADLDGCERFIESFDEFIAATRQREAVLSHAGRE